ncbi:hypothetical protein [Flavobacterium okayamense]|uniref:Uncharacterized protein n=1 Tax=Flavobacterium okayamense TaxID=2830782 RepID=A0ABN6HYF3_9FLAO|nr:hypothetical protein [Flavobacterium okayamense]BCY28790.1 hypothetical protein KK2020170_16580 [Flavobacterium okayamense]
MKEFINPQNIVVIISTIVYAIVFIIQKAQFAKQNEILNKYEKIFSIFNIDEIEKYVELQKKSINLSLNNREVALKNIETDMENRMSEIKKVHNLSKSTLDSTQKIIDDAKRCEELNINYMNDLNELNIKEFDELYSVIEKSIKANHPEIFKKIEVQISKNKEKHLSIKNEVFKRFLLEKLDFLEPESQKNILDLIRDMRK